MRQTQAQKKTSDRDHRAKLMACESNHGTVSLGLNWLMIVSAAMREEPVQIRPQAAYGGC